MGMVVWRYIDYRLTYYLFIFVKTISMFDRRPKKHFKNEQRSSDATAKKRVNTSGVRKINHYC